MLNEIVRLPPKIKSQETAPPPREWAKTTLLQSRALLITPFTLSNLSLSLSTRARFFRDPHLIPLVECSGSRG